MPASFPSTSDMIRAKLDMPLGIRLSLYEDDEDGYDADYGIEVERA